MGQVDPARLLGRPGRLPLVPRGPVATLPFEEETYTVSRLCGEVQDLLAQAFSRVWVAGEVQRVHRSRRGHVYFELVEKGAGDDIVGRLEAAVWRTDYERLGRTLAASGVEIAEGVEIRCSGGLDFYPPHGRLKIVIREVDPVFTVGLLARRRRETLEWLAARDLLDCNRGLALPVLPLRLALVTSAGSAAYHDFLSTLRGSGYGFRVLLLHASVQGREAERELLSALSALPGLEVDCAVLVRGGGSRADLAVFDSRPLAEAIALAPVPVVTGLGHEIDQAIADLVAHTASKTPTGAAELLVERVRRADEVLGELRRGLRRESLEPLRRARVRLAQAERGARLVALRLDSTRRRLADVGRLLAGAARSWLRAAGQRTGDRRRRLALAAPRLLASRRATPGRLGARVTALARARLRESAARVEGLERLCAGLSPRRTLERGFTITRDGAGRLVRDPAQVGAGDRITTTTRGGDLVSRVESG